MTRLADEHDRADSHDLEDVTEIVGAWPGWFSSCFCGWDSDQCFTKPAARQEHDTHQDVQLGMSGARSNVRGRS